MTAKPCQRVTRRWNAAAHQTGKRGQNVQNIIDQFVASLVGEIKSNKLKLPTLPEVAMRVRDTVNDADVSATKVAKVISADTALTARLMQVANSPLFRGTSRIESLQSAIARLGVPQVRSLVTSLIMQQLFKTHNTQLKTRMQHLWEHSTEVAAISSVLARKYTSLKSDEAMLAGLIHDIGALPILAKMEAYPELLCSTQATDDVIEKLHPSIGRLILEAWKFPADLVNVTAQHEDFAREVPRVDYVDVVMVANLHSYVGSAHRHARANWATIPAFRRLGLTPDQSVSALEEARQEVSEVKKLLAA